MKDIETETKLSLTEYKKLNLQFLTMWLAMQLIVFVTFDNVNNGGIFATFGIKELILLSFAMYASTTSLSAIFLSLVFKQDFKHFKSKETPEYVAVLLYGLIMIGIAAHVLLAPQFDNVLPTTYLIFLSIIISIFLYYTNFSIKAFTGTSFSNSYAFKKATVSSHKYINSINHNSIESVTIGHWRHKASNPEFYRNRNR